jgi:hypothetical protein
VSYNGGTGGVVARPNAAEEAAMHEQHVQATSLQTQHEETARNDRTMLASYNHGRPAVAATARPGEFHGAGAVSARAANLSGNRPNGNTDTHMDRPPSARNTSSYNANQNQNRSVDRPQTAAHPTTTPSNTNRPANNNGNSGNNNHSSKPPQQTHPNTDRPPEHEARPSHEGAGHGR